MKNFIVPFMAMALFMVSDASAQCAGGAGAGFGFNSYNCDFPSSLWAGYCNGGPAMPAAPARSGCSLGLGGGGGCGGGGGLMSHLQGLLGRLGGGGGCGGGCGGSAAPTCPPAYGVHGFGAYAGGGCATGSCGNTNTWWYGGSGQSIGRPSRCGSGGCHLRSRGGGGGCGAASSCGGGGRHCGGGHGLFSHFRNRMAYSSWIGGGPLDTYSLVAGYGGFVGSQMDYGCINGACSGDFGAAMPAASADCGCSGSAAMPAYSGEAVQSGEYSTGETYGQEVYSDSYGGDAYGNEQYEGTVEQYAPVEELPVEEGPLYESNPIDAVEEIPAGNSGGGAGSGTAGSGSK